MKDMKYLQKRGGKWHYVRRVPKIYQELDLRGTIRNSLGTDSLSKARNLRNAQAEREDQQWRTEFIEIYGTKAEREEAAYKKALIITESLNLKLIDVEAITKLPAPDITVRSAIDHPHQKQSCHALLACPTPRSGQPNRADHNRQTLT